jgi:hypothetical protein
MAEAVLLEKTKLSQNVYENHQMVWNEAKVVQI